MRIGILTTVHPATDTRILFKQAATLRRGGHDVTLVARASASPVGHGIRHVALPMPRSRWARIAAGLRLLRVGAKLRCDAYHLHDPELLPIGVALRFRTGAAIIFDVHEDVRRQIHNKYWLPRWLRPALAAAYACVERVCLRFIDHVVIAEDSYAPIYAHHHPIAVRNYPTLDVFEGIANWDQPRRYSGCPRLVYCGNVSRIRGAFEMLEAVALLIARHPRVHLSVIGACFPESLEEDLRQRIEALRVESHVTLYGRLPLDHAMQLVAGDDIGLALLHPDPNYLHSLPTKMFEYMALRLPVVVSDFALWRGIVEESAAGVTVDPLAPAAIAAVIDRIASDPGAMARMGERGCDAVRALYSWEPEGRRLLDLYATLARERGLADVNPIAPAAAPRTAHDEALLACTTSKK